MKPTRYNEMASRSSSRSGSDYCSHLRGNRDVQHTQATDAGGVGCSGPKEARGGQGGLRGEDEGGGGSRGCGQGSEAGEDRLEEEDVRGQEGGRG